MKFKHYFISLFVISGVLFLFASILQAAGPQATVLLVEGQVTFRPSANADWQELRQGQKLSENSHILTSKNSRCEINLGMGKSAAQVSADSYVILESLDPISLRIQSGKIYALARNLKRGSSFQVKTPTVIAAARGTGWIETLNSVDVTEDVVHVENQSGQSIDVPFGKGIDISDDGKLGDLRDVKDSAKEDWKEFESSSNGNSDNQGNSDSDDRALQDLNNLDKATDQQSDLKDTTTLSKDEKILENELKPDEDKGGSY